MNRIVENPVFEIHDLTVSYTGRPVLWNIDLTVPAGVLAGIIGPNGAGKSTLIKAALGLTPASSGYAKFFGQTLEAIRGRIAYVPQRSSVDWDFPASVLDTVLMGTYGKLGLFRRPGKAEKEWALHCLEQVGMPALRDRQIAQLSGGQQQRVFLARALAQRADLYFLDEPFAGVDMATEAAIMELLRTLRGQGKTLIVVHHDLRSAADYFDWLILLNQRLVASSPTPEAFTEDLLQETYGGRLTLLSNLGELFEARQFPRRESGKDF